MVVKDIVKKIINHKSETILGAGLLMSGLTFLGSLLGFVRNALLAGRFGASHALDIYYASFRLPDLIYNIFIVGAISAAFIPLFNEYLSEDKNKAWRFATLIMLCSGVLLVFFGILIIIFARPLLSFLLAGFSQENLQLVVFLTKIMMIQPLLLGISSIISGILRSFRLFFITALASLMYNFGIIIGIIFLVPVFGLKGLVLGVIAGACFHLMIQLPSVIEIGYRFQSFTFSEFSTKLKKIITIIFTRTSGIIIFQVFLMGIVSIAAQLKEGTLAILSFVDNILPYTIFALPLADAVFPYLSKLEAEKKQQDFLKTSREILIQILLFLIPLAVWLIVFREPIVRLLLGYGKFDWQATTNTIKALSILSVGMIFQGVNYYLLKVFFAKKDAKRPFFAGILAYSIGFIFCHKLGLQFGIGGLAQGIVITYFLYALILLYFLRVHINYSFLSLKEFYKTMGKIIIISAISGLIGFLVLSWMSDILSFDKVKYLIFDAGIAFIAVLLSFFILSGLLQLKEVTMLKLFIIKKFYGRRK